MARFNPDWQTPPYNPRDGGFDNGGFDRLRQRQTMSPSPEINPQKQGVGQTPPIMRQPQNMMQMQNFSGQDFIGGGTGLRQPPRVYPSQQQPTTTVTQDQNVAPMQPLEGEFIPSSMPNVPYTMQAPQGNYGLSGAEQAIQQGVGGQAGALTQGAYDAFGTMQRGYDQARGDITRGFDTGLSSLREGVSTGRGDIRSASQGAINRFEPYAQGGQAAYQRELAFTGALGPEAQAQAFEDYQASPGQEWARNQQEQSLLRNQSAVGGLGGGNVLTALQEQAAGIASQNYQQDLGNLRSLAGRGQEAAGAQAGIQTQAGRDMAQMAMTGGQSGQAAAMQSGQQLANLAAQTGMSQAQIQQILGQNMSNVYGTGAANISGLRMGAGQQIAQQLGLTGQQLAQLQMGQGTNLANMDQQTAANMANFSAQQGQQTSGLRTGLASLLANLATGQGSQQANLALQMGNAQAGGVTNPWGNTISTLTGMLAQNPQMLSGMIPTQGGTPTYNNAPSGPPP